MFKLRNSITILLLIPGMMVGGAAHASSTRSLQADAIQSSDLTKTITLPAATGTAMLSVGLVQEVPSGSVNGSNVTFTLANTPTSAATVYCTEDGIFLTQGSGKDYTISGATITMATAPGTGQVIWCAYSKY